MTKQDFLSQLKARLRGLPNEEIEQRIIFYEEIIDDKIEEGFEEERAVESLGSLDDVINGILAEIPLSVIVKKRIKPKRKLAGWELGLIIAGSPIWAVLLISLFAIALSLYASFFAVVISMWAVVVSFAAAAVSGVAMLFVGLAVGKAPMGFAMLGAGLFFAGFTVFAYFAAEWLAKSFVKITVKIPTLTKRFFMGKGDKNEQN